MCKYFQLLGLVVNNNWQNHLIEVTTDDSVSSICQISGAVTRSENMLSRICLPRLV